MTEGLKRVWAEMVQPLLRRPPQLQVAALCCRQGRNGTEVLLITSRDTRRWIVPKGWPMDDLSAPDAAREEAWEEAGVLHADLSRDPIGTYEYEKRLDGGYVAPVTVKVYRLDVTQLSDIYPEAAERQRAWVSPAEAAERVREPKLKDIFLNL